MSEPRLRKLIVLVGASVGIVGIALFWVGRGGAPARPVAPEPVARGSFGVVGAASDSARRRDGEAVAEPVVAPLPAASPVAPEPPRPDRPTEAQVSPAIVPSAADLARSEAIAAVMPAVKKEVAAGVDAQRTAIRNACWKGGNAASASFPIEASFAADGSLLALSIFDDRAAPEVGACVRAQPLPLAIEPPGIDLTVQVALTLP